MSMKSLNQILPSLKENDHVVVGDWPSGSCVEGKVLNISDVGITVEIHDVYVNDDGDTIRLEPTGEEFTYNLDDSDYFKFEKINVKKEYKYVA
jgi:hypothetical protein